MNVRRVPRSGSMIISMFLALVATTLLPVVFIAALTASADAHPRSPLDMLRAIGRPVGAQLARLVDRLR
jgi:hypothetical protein